MSHIIICLVFAAVTSQPASRPAPDLSRMTAERLRSYATGLFNRVAYLEQQLATERRTSDALRKTVADGDAKIIELSQEVERLRKVEEAYGETAEGKRATTFGEAIAKKSPAIGMTVDLMKHHFGKGTVVSEANDVTVYKFRTDTYVYYLCDVKNGKVICFHRYVD